jgi:hypothetical protein
MKIQTSCGKTFEMSASEMSDRQLQGLVEQKANRTDLDPADIAELRAELARRSDVASSNRKMQR